MNQYRNKLFLIIIFGFLFNLSLTSCSMFAQSKFNGEKAFQFLVKQTDFGPRNPGSKGHQACLEYLKSQLEEYGGLVSLQPFFHYDAGRKISLTMTNIIGSFNPENQSRIILCAHWDTRPMADRDIPENLNTPILGANDAASGVAVLLEMARQFQKKAPPVGVDIIFLDGEDYGNEGDLDNYCLGSRYFVENNQKYFPRFAILLDMIGDAQLEIPMEGYSRQYAPAVVDLVWKAAAEISVYQFYPYVKQYIFDDHVILNEAGIPAIDIIDFDYPDRSQKYWHTLQDTPDKCAPVSLQAVGDVLMKVIYELSP